MSDVDEGASKVGRLAQAQAMIDRFVELRGRARDSRVGLAHFLEEERAAGRLQDGPLLPSTDALVKVAKNGRLV